MFECKKAFWGSTVPPLVVTAIVVLALPSRASAGTLTVKNMTTMDRFLKSVTGVDPDSTAEETVNAMLCIQSKKSADIEFATLNKVGLKSSTWDPSCPKQGEQPGKDSEQDFSGGGVSTNWNYSLMFSSSNDISYNLSASDLDLLKPVPEGTFITISNGLDVTGYFPSDVLFQNVDTGMLFSGSLVSAGQISITSVPEPCSLVLMTIGGLGLVGCGWRRPKQAA